LQNQTTPKGQHNYLINNSLFISLENPEVDNHHTGVSTFAIRTTWPALAGSQRTDPKLQKSFHHTDPKENINFFLQRFKK
jgi:hypothetical protein